VWVKSVNRGTGADARRMAFDDMAETCICERPEAEVGERVIFRDHCRISILSGMIPDSLSGGSNKEFKRPLI